MSFKLLITGLIFAYFIIAIHFSFHVESLAEYSNNFSVLSRSKRQIPFFSNWWSSSSTKKPADLRKQGYINSQSKQAGYGHKSFDLSNDKSLSYNNSGITRNEISERDSRFLSLFTVIKFDNTECLSASGDNGTCYPANECHRRGGAVNGKCARGYGVCCVFSKTCGASTNQNGTYFTHNGYPSSSSTLENTGSCQLTVYKCAPDVCQLRYIQEFIVSGSTTAIPIVCGVNTGNHMYVDVGVDNSPITLSVVTSGPTYSRSWKIKITQIKCRDLGRSPEGCLQYYRGVSGVIRSYNFDFTSGQQLSNQDYTSCIRVERNFCGIRYTACNENVVQFNQQTNLRPRAFSITGQLTNAVGSVVGANNCQQDWVTIPCATNSGRTYQQGNTICQDRICGDTFNSEASTIASPVYSYVKPFRIHYHTDGNETNDSGNRGWCLNFIQQPCSTI